ncbi:hypothetical protein HDV05_004831 [Chytridiales sp. JEL 0842]|nr:hypothetical protein HDV05_004831 [Chytridiales sp. JEL 0842]
MHPPSARNHRFYVTTNPYIDVSTFFDPVTPIEMDQGKVLTLSEDELPDQARKDVHDKLEAWDRDEETNVIVLVKTAHSEQKATLSAPLLKRHLRHAAGLSHHIATLNTPVASILDGHIPGTIAAFGIHNPIRVVTERTTLSLFDGPKSSILIPGSGFRLSRLLDGEYIGRYLALTGQNMVGMEAVMAGLATHHIPSERMTVLVEKLCGVSTSDLRTLDDATEEFVDSSPSEESWNSWALGGDRLETINRCFKHDTTLDIVKALEKERSEFAQSTLALLHQRNPVAMEVALESVKRGAKSDLLGSFKAELMYASNLLGALKNEEVQSRIETLEKYLAAGKKERKQALAQVFDASSAASSVSVAFSSGRSYRDYAYRTVTGQPREEDVRKVVTGEAKGVGDVALTKEEVVDYFLSTWNQFLDSENLSPLSYSPSDLGKSVKEQLDAESDSSKQRADEESEKSTSEAKSTEKRDFFPSKYYFTEVEDPSEPSTRFGRRKDKWGLRQRVAAVVNRRCVKVQADYLGWR